MNVSAVFVGYDYRFGYRAEGDAQKLTELGNKYGFNVTVVDKVEFDGSNYSRNDLAKIIMSAISKMEVEWANTLGLYEMYNIWKNKDMSSVAYKVFDSTLRVLNQVKYKGPQEWKDMLAVNKFLAECHADYTLDTNFNVLISKKHNCILERYELVQKENNVIDEATVFQ